METTINFKEIFTKFISSDKRYLYLDGQILYVNKINQFGDKIIVLHVGQNIVFRLHIDFDTVISDKIFEYILGHANNKGIEIPLQGNYSISDDTLDIPNVCKQKSDYGLIIPRKNGVTDIQVYYCSYMGHSGLHNILKSLGKVKVKDWTDYKSSASIDEQILHFSTGAINGSLKYYFKHRYDCEKELSYDEIQLASQLYKFIVEGNMYLNNRYITHYDTVDFLNILYNIIFNFYKDKGSKYANLMFLKHCYPNFLTPDISLSPFDNDNSIRSSPDKSAPGVYNSIIGNANISEFQRLNPLDTKFFYQKTVKGHNGVAEINDLGYFAFISDLTGGITSDKTLAINDLNQDVKNICETISSHLGQNIQIEYVTNHNGVYIVQLRIFKKQDLSLQIAPEESVVGQTYQSGTAQGVLGKDIIVINEDGTELNDLNKIIGCKGFIYNGKNILSHLLTYTRTYQIPTAINLDTTSIPEGSTVILNCESKQAYLMPHK